MKLIAQGAAVALVAGAMLQVGPAVGSSAVKQIAVRATSTFHATTAGRVFAGKVQRGVRREIAIAGRVGVPDDVVKVRLRIAARGKANGALTLWDSRRSRPDPPTLRFRAGQTRLVNVSVNLPSGRILLASRSAKPVKVAVRVTGYWVPATLEGGAGGGVGGNGGGGRFDIGTVNVTDIWVDPAHGSDSDTGASRGHAFASVDHAWRQIPDRETLAHTGYRIQLVAGIYSSGQLPNYWEDRWGTAEHPIILNSVDGSHAATFTGDINMYNSRHVYVLGVDILRDGDAFHCEQCSYVLLRDMELSGDEHPSDGDLAHETVKVNQSDHFFIEDSDVHGADDNAIDFVAVQSGHVLGNRVHGAQDWCEYAKGGSAYLTISENEFYDCGTGGFTAGQGTGFEFMTSPWIHYEASNIRVVNNIIHDTEGAGRGVNGGYNILLAYNTMYRVGSRSHAVEFVFGNRSCDGVNAAPPEVAGCQSNHDLGGWGTAGETTTLIPNRSVYFFNNVIYNPSGFQSQWQQFQISGPQNQSGESNVPSPTRTDTDLRIVGNIIWNGPPDLELGLGDDSGCQNANPTCNRAQILADNQINTVQPQFIDAAGGNLRPVADSALAGAVAAAIPDFSSADRPTSPLMPVGSTDNSVSKTITGSERAVWGRPGAY